MTQRQAVLLMYIISAILGIAAVLLTGGWRLLCGNNYSAYYYSRSFRCEKDRYFERSLIINLSKLILGIHFIPY